MKDNEYKLFVWEGDGVLQDYTNGMIVVIAKDLSEALAKIQEKCDYCMKSFPINEYKIYPINSPEAFLVWGGE